MLVNILIGLGLLILLALTFAPLPRPEIKPEFQRGGYLFPLLTPSGKSIQGKGIDPDIQILQDVPDELKGKDETKGEASLKGHIKTNDDEKSGSSAYVPPDPKNDKQLIFAVDYLKSGGKLEAPKKAEAPAPKDETKKN